MHRDTPKVVATVAGEKIQVDEEECGDVQGVKDAIGDELEEMLLEKMIPRCQICAGDFLNYTTGRVCIIGQMKYHEECWITGKPSANLDDRQLIPYQAAKYLPDRWILRLLVVDYEDGNNNDSVQKATRHRPLTTLFFHWTTKLSDFQRFVSNRHVQADSIIQIELQLDDQAIGNPNYSDPSKSKTHVQLPDNNNNSRSLLHCELVGNPLSSALVQTCCSRAATQRDDHIDIQLQGTKYHVQHTMHLTIPKRDDTSLLDLAGVRLKVFLRQS